MKGLNTKTRYQVKLMLAVASLALFYDSPGWSVSLSASALIWLFWNGKVESVKNLWWMGLSATTCLISFVLSLAFYVQLLTDYEMISMDKCHLIQQCLACTLIASIVSSIFSEKVDLTDIPHIGEVPQDTKEKSTTTTTTTTTTSTSGLLSKNTSEPDTKKKTTTTTPKKDTKAEEKPKATTPAETPKKKEESKPESTSGNNDDAAAAKPEEISNNPSEEQ